jgi:hypothetical protein
MAAIEDLVSMEASGVLEITGNPSGQIYLDGGRIAYARASWVPSLAVRLRAIAPSLDNGESPLSRDAGDVDAAALMERHGYLTMARLHELIESIVVDAFLVLTIPLAGDSLVGAIHFTPAPSCLTDLFPRLGLDAVREEAARRAERMAEYGLAPTTTVAPIDLAEPTAVLTREQWAVACQIGDRTSARELAMRRGASLSDTVHCLGSLVMAGLCAPVRTSAHGIGGYGISGHGIGGHSHSAPWLGLIRQARPSAEHPSGELRLAKLPSTELVPVQRFPVRVRKPDLAPRPAIDVRDRPSIDVLRQVLTGLRRLS